MNYNKHYEKLISRSKRRSLEEYTESHHIVPKCMGGSDDKDNLVELTPEEHYVAHQLLVKMYPGEKGLVYAAKMMIPNRPSNKMYGWLRRKYCKVVSENQTGGGNSQYGTFWIYNKELQKSKKIVVGEEIPVGWYKGRIIDFGKHIERENNRKFKIQQKVDELTPFYERYVNGETLQSIAKDYPSSYVALYKSFQRYFPKVPRQTGRGNKKGR